MLYLTRKVGEAVVINDEIEVTVIEVRGKTVRLGLTFPTDATVLRREVYDRVQAENRAALGLDIAGQTGAPEDVPAFVTRGPAPDEAG
ncbi:carbon storage regulator CsrA [Tistrella mobilis]|uniref:carbon storage regulator CsrA n=1 Tax=Tistrella mobilis TaxID=171437 RepID=UPI00355898D9